MIGKKQTEKINPTFSSKKGRHPNWNTYEESKYNWRKTYYTRGELKGKKVKKKFKPNKTSIKNYYQYLDEGENDTKR